MGSEVKEITKLLIFLYNTSYHKDKLTLNEKIVFILGNFYKSLKIPNFITT